MPMIIIFGILASPLYSSGIAPASGEASGPYYGGLLTPTADPAPCTSLGVSVLSFPVGGVGQISFPAARWLTASLYGGLSGYPAGFIGSAYLRAHILRPDTSHWGLAAQAQSGIASVFSGGEGDGGFVNAVALTLSSPMKPTRINIGAALHTMPGSEYQAGWENPKDYDFKNPQPTLFVSGGHTFRRSTISTEFLYIAPGADDGWDSVVAGILGGEFSISRAKLKIFTGILVQKPGTANPRFLPVPPIVALAIPL